MTNSDQNSDKEPSFPEEDGDELEEDLLECSHPPADLPHKSYSQMVKCENTGYYFPSTEAMKLLPNYDDGLSTLQDNTVIVDDMNMDNGGSAGEPVFCRICRDGLHDIDIDFGVEEDKKEKGENDAVDATAQAASAAAVVTPNAANVNSTINNNNSNNNNNNSSSINSPMLNRRKTWSSSSNTNHNNHMNSNNSNNNSNWSSSNRDNRDNSNSAGGAGGGSSSAGGYHSNNRHPENHSSSGTSNSAAGGGGGGGVGGGYHGNRPYNNYHHNRDHHHYHHNRDHHNRDHHHHNSYHHSKPWEKPNFKKRFIPDTSTSGSSNVSGSGGGGGSSSGHGHGHGNISNSLNNSNSSWKNGTNERNNNSFHGSSGGSGSGNNSIWRRNSTTATSTPSGNGVGTGSSNITNMNMTSNKESGNHNNHTTSTISKENGSSSSGGNNSSSRDNTINNTTALQSGNSGDYYGHSGSTSLSTSNYSKNHEGGSSGSSSNNITRQPKKFQPPPGKEKSLSRTLSAPSHHTTNTYQNREMKRSQSLDHKKLDGRTSSMDHASSSNTTNSSTLPPIMSTTTNSRWKPAVSLSSSNNSVDLMNKGLNSNHNNNRPKMMYSTDIPKKQLHHQQSKLTPVKSDSLRSLVKPLSTSSSSIAPIGTQKDSLVGSNVTSSNTPTKGSISISKGADGGVQPNSTENNDTTPTTIKLPKLTCASLGKEENITKARKLIRTLSTLVNDGNTISVLSDNIPLPSKDQIHCGLKELESQIDKCKIECTQIKLKYEKREKVMKKAREEKIKAEEDVRRKKEEEERKLVEQREQQAQKDFESSQEIAVNEVNESIKMEMSEEDARLSSEIDEVEKSISALKEEMEAQVQKEVEEKLEKERITIEAEVAKQSAENQKQIDELEMECNRAKAELESSQSIVLSCEKRLDEVQRVELPVAPLSSNVKPDLSEDMDHENLLDEDDSIKADISPRLQRIMSLTKDDPSDMSNLIDSIYQKNREVADTSHLMALSLIPPSPNKEPVSPPGLVHEHPTDPEDDDSIQRYIHHWSNLARQVTGPGNALYTEPSEAPLYKNIEEKHESIKLLVKEHVRGKKRKLHTRWVELAQEYAIRQEKYSKETKINTSSFTSADVGDLPILARVNEYSPENGGGRSTANPYRRARRNMSGMSGSDVVRSEYEQDLIIAQLKAKENMEKRIKQGGSKLPRQVCEIERETHVSYRDTLSSRRVEDPMAEAMEQRQINPWSDIEKCIFLDRFLQHPKDFRKIASFLKNKSVHDCISFYYDSKQSIPYKRALREHLKRKRRRGDNVKWEATLQAAMSVGATVRAGISTEKPLIFDLPKDDMTFDTHHLHPMKREIFDVVDGNTSPYIEVSDEVIKTTEVKKKHKRKSTVVENLFILEPSKRKYLRTSSDNAGKVSPNISDWDNDSLKVRQVSNTSSIIDSSNTEKKEINDTSNSSSTKKSVKKMPNKWSAEEKAKFHESLDKCGKKWALISEAIGTKTVMQVKNFYYENKKQINKKKTVSAEKMNLTSRSDEQSSSLRTSPQMSEEKDDQSTNQTHAITEKVETGKVVHGFTQENMMGIQEQKTEVAEQQKTEQSVSNLSQSDHWNEQQQRQLALAIEHHRQQQIAEHQQLLEMQRQHEQERARQFNQQMHNLLNQHQMSNLSIPWVAAQQLAQAAMHHEVTRQQRSFREYLDGGSANLQNVAMALRHQPQNNYQLGMNSNNSGDNDTSQRQQTSDLSILAQMATDANRNRDSSNH